MAKNKFLKSVGHACGIITGIGRRIGARRLLFVWSAFSAGIAAYLGVSETIGLYSSYPVSGMNLFVLTRFITIIFAFLKIFVPMFVLVVAMKYIFDADGKRDGRASKTFYSAMIASIVIGLAVGALYYMDAGHIIGNNSSIYCMDGMTCMFSWNMLLLAAEAFAAAAIGSFIMILGMRGVYTELSFMLARKK